MFASVHEKLRGVAEEVRLNLNAGAIAWILHRLTGLVLVAYLLLHLWGLGAAINGKEAFDARMRTFGGGVFDLLEAAVVMIVAFHMFNGLRVIVVDFVLLTRWQKEMFGAVLACFAVVLGYTAWVFFERALG